MIGRADPVEFIVEHRHQLHVTTARNVDGSYSVVLVLTPPLPDEKAALATAAQLERPVAMMHLHALGTAAGRSGRKARVIEAERMKFVLDAREERLRGELEALAERLRPHRRQSRDGDGDAGEAKAARLRALEQAAGGESHDTVG